MFLASSRGHYQALKLLIAMCEDLDVRIGGEFEDSRKSPEDVARSQNHVEVASLLHSFSKNQSRVRRKIRIELGLGNNPKIKGMPASSTSLQTASADLSPEMKNALLKVFDDDKFVFPITTEDKALKAVKILKSFEIDYKSVAVAIRVHSSTFTRWRNKPEELAVSTKRAITNVVIQFLNRPMQELLLKEPEGADSNDDDEE